MAEMSTVESLTRAPEARYAYYPRCQVFRRNGVQCKAPSEKGSYICHAHAGQLATAVRRERERRAVLAEAVAEMRQRGKPECEPVDLFMDFKGIQVTVAKMAQALIDGRIDCKTAGRMVVQLQMASKLLWIYHRGHRGAQREKTLTTKDTRSTPLSQAQGRSGQATEHEGLPQICADDRRKVSTTKDTKEHEGSLRRDIDECRLAKREELPELFIFPRTPDVNAGNNWAANQREKLRILEAEASGFRDLGGWAHGPPEWASAA
jgi:hypothetical protein